LYFCHSHISLSSLFFFYYSLPYLDLPSFPTRRSSDLISLLAYRPRLGNLEFHGSGRIPNDPRAMIRTAQFANPGATPIGKTRNQDRKSTRLNSSHLGISYAVFCLKKKKKTKKQININ